MFGRFVVCCLIAAAGFLAATKFVGGASTAAASPAAEASVVVGATVVHVVDGDTLVARLAGGKRERIRVLGINAPEMQPRERCAVRASEAARRLAQGKTIALTADRTQAARDRFKRLLAYVTLPGGSDFGKRMLATGYAKVYVVGGRPFLRVSAYRAAEKGAKASRSGIWGDCSAATVIPVPAPRPAPPASPTITTPTSTVVPFVPTVPTTTGGTTTTPTTPPPTTTTTAATTTAPSPSPGCHPSYPDFCIPPPPPDKDCKDFTQKNFRVLHNVANPDPHGLDGNKDGRGCES